MLSTVHLELIEQTALLQLSRVLIGDAEIPASKDLIAETLKAVLILNQVPLKSCGRP